MRHPVRDRLVMLLFALVSFGVAALLLAVTFGFVMTPTVDGWVIRILEMSAVVKIAGAVVCVLLGFALLGAMLPPKKKRSSSFAIQQNENGMVRISLKTIDALVNKCLGQHDEIKVVTSSLFSDEETVRVDVHIALLTDISMPLAISALQKQITKYVEACSGVNVKEVRVFVDAAIPGDEKAQNSKYVLPSSILGEAAEDDAEAFERLNEQPQEEEAVEETPVIEAISAEEVPVAQTAPVLEEALAVEETAKAEETVSAEEAVTAEEPLVANASADGEQTPAVEETPVEEACAAEEETIVAEEAAAAQEEPVKKKGFFGLFGKK